MVSRKTAEPGMQVSPGQQIMALVPLDDVWVTANFKETQFKKMHVGQKVEFEVDTFGSSRKYRGHIDSIAAASGAKFSLLPPENATGNYVKVVQRVPVKILLEPGENRDHLLLPGMSVNPTVLLDSGTEQIKSNGINMARRYPTQPFTPACCASRRATTRHDLPKKRSGNRNTTRG